ncbi:MAG: hypothetical protein IMF11_22420 [Proteobacteria bacterium]|nr:hypothetical protein [Pseudomonadota bacterium]
MKIITIAGAPSSGKTSVVFHTVKHFLAEEKRVSAVKFDALSTHDDKIYIKKLKIPALCGISDYVCPDHYYVSNLEEVFLWGVEKQTEVLFIETAGLCFRCAPHIKEVPAITVVDNLSGSDAPAKMGPALFFADVVVITKGDLVSQAEREVFKYRVQKVNSRATIFHLNGLSGKGSVLLRRLIDEWPETGTLAEKSLRYSMPASICSYCTGETRIGQEYQSGNVKKIKVT